MNIYVLFTQMSYLNSPTLDFCSIREDQYAILQEFFQIPRLADPYTHQNCTTFAYEFGKLSRFLHTLQMLLQPWSFRHNYATHFWVSNKIKMLQRILHEFKFFC